MNLLSLITQAFLPPAFAAGSTFMPPAVTEIAKEYDNLYGFILVVSLIGCVILLGGMVYFVVKYKRTAGGKSAYISHNSFLEFLWSFIPLVIFLVVFAWGWKVYHDMRTFPENSLEIHALAQKWSWTFQYKSGKTSPKELVVPINTPIKILLSSKDVLHSFFIPSMRVKQDAVPGRYTALWFESQKLGNFQIFCTEYCGDQHSAMMGTVRVLSTEDYEKWLKENDEALPLAKRGEKIYKGICIACHTLDGNKGVGPSWKGLYGKAREFADGTNIPAADENYIKDSILNPNSKLVKGFAAAMPSYQGQLSDSQINGIVEFMKELK